MAKLPEHSTEDRVAEKREAAEKRRQAAEQHLNAQKTHRDTAVADASAKMDQARPTPTQHEVDMARLGAPVEDKEDDKSGPDLATKVVPAAGTSGGYQTRSVQAGGPGTAHGDARVVSSGDKADDKK